MALNDLGIEVPAATDVFEPDGDMRELGGSMAGRIIIPVANTTERSDLATALSPSASEPLYVHRADAPIAGRLEWTEDGSTWQTVMVPASYAGSNTFPTIAATNTTYTRAITFPAGRFAAAPAVVATLASANASTASTSIWINAVTTTTANVNIQRSATAGAFDFTWIATEIGV